ncbi:protein TASOR-like [Antennarius striatus]|uniref:protein TASOR-like n=1 Tax=Antennarius striatus TaxID=241820 RepID=UPI0035B3791F
MDDNFDWKEHLATRSRRMAVVADYGAVSLQDGEDSEVYSTTETEKGSDRLSASNRRMKRRNSAPQGSHQRHMPMEPLKFPIPRKAKEKRPLIYHVSAESREYDDMKLILTSSYISTTSAGCFSYCKPRLVHNELLEKEFVEKRKEMKSEGRTDKELEESYCFLLADNSKVSPLCEKGLFVSQSWITVLGNPSKGVYLSRYSDLLQVNPMLPGATGDIIIFKVMKGRVKSIYENMKNLFDPTPRFDSHISKNASKVTSLTSFRAFELTQVYFYEYTFDELRQRPRQICPYAVVSFHFKGKDCPLPSTPLPPTSLNSYSGKWSKEQVQFTVWTGDLVKGDKVLFQISFRSYSPPILPQGLPEALDIGRLMNLEEVTKLLPSKLFSYNLYNGCQEVVKDGHCCSLLLVTDRNRSSTSVSRLLHELEIKGVVLVTPLTEGGFLFLLSSVQMAAPSERGDNWKRCLQALFVLPKARYLAKSKLRLTSSPRSTTGSVTGSTVMRELNHFIPALHHALVKVRADPPPELSAGVEQQAREYFIGMNDGKIQHYPMGQYDSKLDEQVEPLPVPKHRVNIDGYLGSYLYSPTLYLLPVVQATLMMEMYIGLEEQKEMSLRKSCGGQQETAGKETINTRDIKTNTEKIQQLMDLVLNCKLNAENEVTKEERTIRAPEKKRRREQDIAKKTLKFLKASRESGIHSKTPVVEGNQVPSSISPLASVIGPLGLKEVDLREDGSVQATELLSVLTGLSRAARGKISPTVGEEREGGQSSPFDKLATKLGLPAHCDIDLRRQEELEELTTGSVSSLEGFSPSSHSGDMNHYGAAGRVEGRVWLGRKEGRSEDDEEEVEIPWVLIPITGLRSEGYAQRDRNIPQDPRFQHITPKVNFSRTSPTPSPDLSSPATPSLCPSPEPSPPLSLSQCPSPEPSPPPSTSQCPSPETCHPPFPSQCPSPEPRSPSFTCHCPSPEPTTPSFPFQHLSLKLSHCPFRCQSQEPSEHRPFNKELSVPTTSLEFSGIFQDKEKRLLGKEKSNEEPSICTFFRPPIPPVSKTRSTPSQPPFEVADGNMEELKRVKEDSLMHKKETTPLQMQSFADMQKRGAEDVSKGKQVEEEEIVEVTHASDEDQKGDTKELSCGSLFSLPTAPCHHLQHIDSIVDKHLDTFASEIQLILQKESIYYSFPQCPHSTWNTEAKALQHAPPYLPITQFSPYVSFYNICPPVQDYISSLHDSINGMLTDLDDSWLRQGPASSPANDDSVLACKVSAFVSNIRVAHAKTDDDVGLCGQVPAADIGVPVCQTPGISRGAEEWKSHTIAQASDPPIPKVTLSDTASESSSLCNTNSDFFSPHPNMSPKTPSKPQHSQTLEVNVRQMQDNSITRTVYCTDGVEGTSCKVTLSGLNSVAHPSGTVSSPSCASVPETHSGPPPPATALSSLIRQLQPEVFTNLEEIMKDIKRNSTYFYLHNTEPEDQVYRDVKEHLLKQGNVEQSPGTFLSQENSDSRLLVIIKNKDISGCIHKIPSLVSLKRHPSVVFLGIDTLDDILNKSYNELFVSGGCIVSDEVILNPDFITHDQLTALLMMLEQHSSVESVWRWKVHFKTHKKLKEQSRFRRDAANLLDILSAYHKRQIVEFLPYHDCDMMNHRSPDLDCIMELQARYIQYRHMVLMTEDLFVEAPGYSSRGIIMASMKEIMHNFTTLVSNHDVKDNHPIIDDLLSPQEHFYPLSFHQQPEHLYQFSSVSFHPLSHSLNQLMSDTSCKEGVTQHSGKDFKDLQEAILKFRAERQAQHQQQRPTFEPGTVSWRRGSTV